jgi:undecaprenyl-diphosphatase
MTLLVALILGVVEGLTEYLPVSSTGHLILVDHFLGAEGSDARKSFEIVIQLGAILAVLVHYRGLLLQRARDMVAGKPEGTRLFAALVAGFVPTAALGLVARKAIKAHLFGPKPVAYALAIGGAVMIVVELVRGRKADDGESRLEEVTPWRGFLVGVGQCASLIPGTSRSMATIVTGQLVGLTTATAAEFSFLLALPTLGAATIYEAWKSRLELATLGIVPMAVGMVTSFLVAWMVIAVFIAYLKRRGLVPFGVYRIILGAAVLFLLVR